MLGKTTLAFIYARALLCTGRDGAGASDPLVTCGECFPCRALLKGPFADFAFVLPRTKEITVTVVAEEYDNFAFAVRHPSNSPKRVVLIDSAHTLNTTTSNMMLKLFEEAPEATVFILATDHPYDLLPTVRSRCEEVKFTEESIELIESNLRASGFDRNVAAKAAQYSQGKWVLARMLTADFSEVKLNETKPKGKGDALARLNLLDLFDDLTEQYVTLAINLSNNAFIDSMLIAVDKLAGRLVESERRVILWTLPERELLTKDDKKTDERYEISQTRVNELKRQAFKTVLDHLRVTIARVATDAEASTVPDAPNARASAFPTLTAAERSIIRDRIAIISALLARAELWLLQNVVEEYILEALVSNIELSRSYAR